MILSKNKKSCPKVFNGWLLHDVPMSNVVEDVFTSDALKLVFTPNVDHFYRLEHGGDFFDAYRAADVLLCDSRIVAVLSRREAEKILNVCPGSDLTVKLLSDQRTKCRRVFFIGPDDDDVKFVAKKFGLTNFGSCAPRMGFINDSGCVDEVIRSVKEFSPDFVFLACGSPQQEVLALKIKQSGLSKGVVFGIGASIDFVTGKQIRAPYFLQVAHLEWLHRVFTNPKRMIKRYLFNFFWVVRYLFGYSNRSKF